MYVDHPLIKENSIQDRGYQRTLADSCYYYSTLVVLPTGLGKTVIALLVMAETLHHQGGKALFLAPTKPLVEQHASFLMGHLVGKSVIQMTGEKDPETRSLEWSHNDVIVSTPQVIANDLRKGRIDLRDVKLVIFDEAHRAVGRYAYVAIANALKAGTSRVMGITASPGGTKARIKAVCDNLNVRNIEVRSEDDPDVVEHIHDISLELVTVDLPPRMREISALLRSMYDTYTGQLVNMGFLKAEAASSVRYVIEMNKSLRIKAHARKSNGFVFKAMSLQAMAIKVGHAMQLAETQGVAPLTNYLGKLKAEARSKSGSKASQRIVSAPQFLALEALLGDMEEVHPKMPEVVRMVSSQLQRNPDSKVMVFTNYRDSCEAVSRCLAEIEGARISKLIGQTSRANDKGQRQSEQVEVLSRLRRGDINTIVATCVGEEGLDVANTDLVIFYEPVPSEIRSIQRRGRTGRSRPGRVVVLITAGTSDEPSLSSSTRKEEAMRRHLLKIKQGWNSLEEARQEGEAA